MPFSYLLSKDFKLEVSAIHSNYSNLKSRAILDAAFERMVVLLESLYI